jgi:hypothetical protein
MARQGRFPGGPGGSPFGYPFEQGFVGALFSPRKSLFLFDPLLLILILCLAFQWKGIGRDLRRFLTWMAVMLLLDAAFYATYFAWGGDVAWGDRFVTLPVHLACLFAAPMLLAAGEAFRRPVRRLSWCIVVAALALQAMSTTLLANLEVHQGESGYGDWVLVNRVVNLTKVISGQEDEPRFAGEPSRWRTFNYLPFQLRFRYPKLAAWATAGWVLLLISLPFLVWLAISVPGRGDRGAVQRDGC